MNVRTNRIIPPLIVAFVLATTAPTFAGRTIYVDDDGPADFSNIQAAIDDANDGDEIIVSIGTYYENIDFDGKNITLRSMEPLNPVVVANTIIDGRLGGSVVTFSGTESSACVLSGFTITNGRGTGVGYNYGGGIYGNGTVATIQYNIISGNRAASPLWPCSGFGGGLYDCDGTIQCNIISRNGTICDEGSASGGGLFGCDGTIQNNIISNNSALGFGFTGGGGLGGCNGNIQNNTIFGNLAGDYGGGLSGCNGTIINCIIWQNTAAQGAQIDTSSTPSYSCIQDWSGGGMGNINFDPCFVDAAGDDYHLSLLSPCIDAGDPCYSPAPGETDIDGEPRVLNSHIDIGADEVNNEEPLIGVTPGKIEFLSQESGPNPEPQIISIWNAGADVIDWQIIEDCKWLEAWPTNGVSTGQINEVTLTVDASGLGIGSYAYSLEVHDPIATNSPQTVSVALHIFSEVVHVPSQMPTIQGAIDHVLDGGTVIVADGIYTGPGNRDVDFKGKPITVTSEKGPENCIIDCDGTEADPHRGFHFHKGEDADSILNGFTITNGYAENGGGIYCSNSSPTIDNCIVSENTSFADTYLNGGGGMRNDNSSPTLTNCVFTNNLAVMKGGGMFNEWSNPTLTNCIFSDNSARHGGAIRCTGSSPILVNCVFTNNLAAKKGGGMDNHQNSSPMLVNCRFIENSTGSDAGGGMLNRDSNPTLINCIFSGNSANGSYSYGGGISNYWSNPTLTNCVFENNSSNTDGGGVCNYESSPVLTNCVFSGNSAGQNGGGMAQWFASRPTIKNCTFSGNSAISQGGGLHNRHYSCSPTLTNCILWGDIPTEIYLGSNSAAVITYSAVQGGWPGEGNIDADPCFAESGYWDPNNTPDDTSDDFWVHGDYHLKSEGWRWDGSRQRWHYDETTSRCIDAGNPSSPLSEEPISLPEDPNNIWAENIRINMGAYGGTPEASIPPYHWALLADMTNDGLVDFRDYAAQADDWLNPGDSLPGDLNRDSVIGIPDLALIAEDWLKATSWHE